MDRFGMSAENQGEARKRGRSAVNGQGSVIGLEYCQMRSGEMGFGRLRVVLSKY